MPCHGRGLGGAAGQEEVKVRVDPGLEVGIFARNRW